MSDETPRIEVGPSVADSLRTAAELNTIRAAATEQLNQLRTAAGALQQRMAFFSGMGLTFGGNRDMYTILGYKPMLTTWDYRDRYNRGGLAGRVVDVFPNATWRGAMTLSEDKDIEKDTPFEKAWKDLDQKHQIQAKLLRVDKLSLLSTYAVLLIGVKNSKIEEPLAHGGPDDLLYLQPYPGGGGPGGDPLRRTLAVSSDCTVKDFDLNLESARFGLPNSYFLQRTSINTPMIVGREIHWSHIIHVCDGRLVDEVYGQPALERVWNLLDDLDKVTGGGAEAFWLRANQGMHMNIEKDFALPDDDGKLEALKKNLAEQAQQYSDQMTRWIRTRGTTVTPLGSDVANFQSPADAIITQIAGSKGIPKRILTGSEMGELASSQDRENWKDQVDGRQTSYAGPYIVRTLADRLIEFGYLTPAPAAGPSTYVVKWPHQQVLTEEERATGAAKWAEVNKSAGRIVFTDEEIREHWYGMAALVYDDTDIARAELALKFANINKTAGVTIITSAQIRKICYGWEPLSPEEETPVSAPERVSVNAPPVQPRTALEALTEEDTELLRVLEAAVEANNTDVIDAILGTSHA